MRTSEKKLQINNCKMNKGKDLASPGRCPGLGEQRAFGPMVSNIVTANGKNVTQFAL
jgi:hypothetical protein